jgi:membrane dipeptidase
MPYIFDAHLDLSLNALHLNRDLTLELEELNRKEKGMTDLLCRGNAVLTMPELQKANTAVCLATVLARWNPNLSPKDGFNRAELDYATRQITGSIAYGQATYYTFLEETGHLRMIKTKEDLERHWKRCVEQKSTTLPVGYILAMEGADPITKVDHAAEWYEAGLRVASLTHYGMSAYAGGTGTTGGLTDEGKELLDAFEKLGIVLDLSHLSDKAFDEALDTFSGPVMASHNNCRALVPGGRQYSDDQIRRIIERKGVIGISFDAWMLAKGWVRGTSKADTVPLTAVVDHIDHIRGLSGSIEHVALGTDLDGGYGNEQTPKEIRRYTDMQKLAAVLSERGYLDEDIDKIFHANWLNFFRLHLP